MSRAAQLLAGLLLALVIPGPFAAAQFYASELRAVSPTGGQVGTTFDLRATVGTNLDEVDSLHFLHPGITAQLKTLDPLPLGKERRPHYGHFTVTVAADVPPGRYEVRAAGRHGVSNPRAFLVTSLANEIPKTISHDINAPTPLPAGTLLHGKATAANVDYFSLQINEAQSIRIELLAQQLDSRMIGQLKLYGPDGRAVAAARGADDADPVVSLDGLAPGQYVLAVHDFTYRGGDEFHYQVVAREAASAISFFEHDSSVKGQLPRTWSTEAFALRGQETLAATAESPESQTIDLPAELVQWFPSQQRDSAFEFAAKEGDTYAIDIVSQRVGQPTDARLILERIEPQQSGPPKLHNVLNVDDSQILGDGTISLRSKDPVAMFNSPATANYRLTIRDLDSGQSLRSRQSYKLRIGPPNPGFDLLAYRLYPHRDVNQTQPLGSKLFRAGAELIRVFAIRRDGWTGPIKIAAENLPPGVTATEANIASNQQQTQLTLSASEDAAAAVAPIRLVGRSEDDSILQQAVPATVTWGKGGGRDFIRSRIVSSLFVAVSDKDLSPLSITLGDGTAKEVKKGESIVLPIKLARREGGKTPCVLRARDFPPGVSGGDVTIPADKDEGGYTVKVASGAAAGTYSLWLQVETKIKVKPNPQALTRAEQYRSHLQSLHDDPAQAANLESIKSAITEADKLVDAAKKGPAKEQELTVFIPTSNATLRVIDP